MATLTPGEGTVEHVPMSVYLADRKEDRATLRAIESKLEQNGNRTQSKLDRMGVEIGELRMAIAEDDVADQVHAEHEETRRQSMLSRREKVWATGIGITIAFLSSGFAFFLTTITGGTS
jgi:hypothetical protein